MHRLAFDGESAKPLGSFHGGGRAGWLKEGRLPVPVSSWFNSLLMLFGNSLCTQLVRFAAY
jgi:hypothetical protein